LIELFIEHFAGSNQHIG